MRLALDDVIAAGMELAPEEREIVALALQTESDGQQADIDAAWRDTIARRLDDIESGRVQLVSGRETTALALARLESRRQR